MRGSDFQLVFSVGGKLGTALVTHIRWNSEESVFKGYRFDGGVFPSVQFGRGCVEIPHFGRAGRACVREILRRIPEGIKS